MDDLTSTPVEAKPRKLKTGWTVENNIYVYSGYALHKKYGIVESTGEGGDGKAEIITDNGNKTNEKFNTLIARPTPTQIAKWKLGKLDELPWGSGFGVFSYDTKIAYQPTLPLEQISFDFTIKDGK